MLMKTTAMAMKPPVNLDKNADYLDETVDNAADITGRADEIIDRFDAIFAVLRKLLTI